MMITQWRTWQFLLQWRTYTVIVTLMGTPPASSNMLPLAACWGTLLYSVRFISGLIERFAGVTLSRVGSFTAVGLCLLTVR